MVDEFSILLCEHSRMSLTELIVWFEQINSILLQKSNLQLALLKYKNIQYINLDTSFF